MARIRCSWAAALAILLAESIGAQASTSLLGRVLTDSSDEPISEAAVSIDNGRFSVSSDSLGRFRILALSLGTHSLLIRRLGFVPFTTQLVISAVDTVKQDFFLKPLQKELAKVVVGASVSERKLSGFEDRRRLGVGRFLNASEVEKAPGSRMSETLRNLPGILILYSRTGTNQVRVATTRGPQGFRSGPCLAAIMLDGVLVTDFSINSIDPDEIAAVEWYAGPSQIPAQFNTTRNACGLLVLWTR